MAKNLYVGNLSYGVTGKDLQNLFKQYGMVRSAHVITDRDTGRSKGFGFVEMDRADEAQDAIDAVDAHEVNGRMLTVNQSRPTKLERAMPVEFASDYFG